MPGQLDLTGQPGWLYADRLVRISPDTALEQPHTMVSTMYAEPRTTLDTHRAGEQPAVPFLAEPS